MLWRNTIPLGLQRSVDMDTKKMDTGVHVHITDMDRDFSKNRDMDIDTR